MFLFGQHNGYGCTFAQLALQIHAPFVVKHAVFNDGKPKARAAGFLVVALIRAVKAFKNTLAVRRADADAGIAYADGLLWLLSAR